MCFDYDETAEFYRESIVKARAPHKCECCRREMARGELYLYGSGKFDGRMFTQKRCLRCAFDTARIVAHELDEGCGWHEAWPGNAWDVREWYVESGVEQTPLDAVPAFKWKEDWPNKVVESLRKTKEAA